MERCLFSCWKLYSSVCWIWLSTFLFSISPLQKGSLFCNQLNLVSTDSFSSAFIHTWISSTKKDILQPGNPLSVLPSCSSFVVSRFEEYLHLNHHPFLTNPFTFWFLMPPLHWNFPQQSPPSLLLNTRVTYLGVTLFDHLAIFDRTAVSPLQRTLSLPSMSRSAGFSFWIPFLSNL